MTLITRITRLFKADIHGILDSLEEPKAVLKQAVRDMEAEISENLKQLEEVTALREQAICGRKEHEKAVTEISQQIELCFRANNHALAKSCIRKKLEKQKRIEATIIQIGHFEKAIELLNKTLSERKDRLEHIKSKIELFADNSRSFNSDSLNSSGLYPESIAVTDEEVELYFIDAMEQRKPQDSQNQNSF